MIIIWIGASFSQLRVKCMWSSLQRWRDSFPSGKCSLEVCAVCVKSGGLPLMISISSLSRPDMCLLHTSRPVARKSKSTFDSERFCTVLHFQFQEASRTPFQAWQAECEDERGAEDQKVNLKELLELDYLVEESQ